jgi:hypothetical protein
MAARLVFSSQRAVWILAIELAALASLMPPTLAQDFGEHTYNNKPTFPVDTRPKVDERAYKAALEKIPAPTQKYDPWGSARPPEPAKAGKKSN